MMTMRITFCAAILAGLVTAAPAFADQCILPPPPSKIPDGNSASKQQMITAMNTLKEYNGDVSVYLHCLDFQVKQSRLSADVRDLKHDAAVTQLQAVAGKFNAQVRVFKSKHG